MSNPPHNQENQPQENRQIESINNTTSSNSSIVKGGRVLTKDLLSMLQKMQKDQQKFIEQQQELNTRILSEIKINENPDVMTQKKKKKKNNNMKKKNNPNLLSLIILQ